MKKLIGLFASIALFGSFAMAPAHAGYRGPNPGAAIFGLAAGVMLGAAVAQAHPHYGCYDCYARPVYVMPPPDVVYVQPTYVVPVRPRYVAPMRPRPLVRCFHPFGSYGMHCYRTLY